MVGTPVDVLPYIRGVQLVLTGYNGYTKNSRIENDKLVRDELVRVVNRIRNHMKNIFDNKFKDGNMSLARNAKRCMEECDYFTEDVRHSSDVISDRGIKDGLKKMVATNEVWGESLVSNPCFPESLIRFLVQTYPDLLEDALLNPTLSSEFHN